jgi:tRNA-specific 2-thiouridylase
VIFQTHIETPGPVAVAMSGGVDSSLAAVLLKEAGYRVIGLTMQLWGDQDRGQTPRCCSSKAIDDARAICRQWDIDHHLVDLRKEFSDRVVRSFIHEYLQGRTPNPCVVCNADIKWRCLLPKARELGARALATGHYARIREDRATGRFQLLRGADEDKDQSYALWGLSQDDLAVTILPLGGLDKGETRRLARERDLPVAGKRESQEICFVPEDDYGTFIEEHFAPASPESGSSSESYPWSPGPIVDQEGNILGQHRGLPFYTVGQRRGLGLALGRPVYVVDIDRPYNRLVVGTERDLLKQHLWAHRLNWMSSPPPGEAVSCEVQIRYNHRAAPARLVPLSNGDVHVEFDRPQRAITPGQSAVFYDRGVVLGGGIIRRPGRGEVAELLPEDSAGDRGEPF